MWQPKLVPATSENREIACRFVYAQELGPQTASYDALEAALTFDAEAIYFLTDGAPFGGKVTQPVQIVTLITKLNRLRRMTINSIGIGVGANGNVFDAFLKALADSQELLGKRLGIGSGVQRRVVRRLPEPRQDGLADGGRVNFRHRRAAG